MKKIYCDGGLNIQSFFNPQSPRGQAVAKVNFSKDQRLTLYLDSNDNTNQEAEIFALFFALMEAIKNNIKVIYTDSQWLVGAISYYKLKEPRLKLPCLILRSLIKHYQIEVKWIERENNLAT